MTHMEEFLSNISETESRYFADIFLCCDVEKTGKVPILKATELFRSANLSNDIIRQILQLATIPQSALFVTRKQFYSCLKLIAAHQAAVPLRADVIPTSTALPLPRFSWRDSPTSLVPADTTNGDTTEAQWIEVHSPNLIQLSNNSDTLAEAVNSDLHSTDSEIEHNDTERTGERDKRRPRDGSPEAWSTASDSPTPTNSVAERPWAKGNLWHGLLCEEQRQLLATEEESSDRHSSDDEVDLESVFQITPEQREYYNKQFRTVQPDPNGLLSGPVAKMFFEKSRIPVEELRRIWQLCDVTRDGALSLEEFTAAMHLVVLRKNSIPLPQHLPPCLLPGGGAATAGVGENSTQAINQPNAPKNPPEADLLHLNDDDGEGEDDDEADGSTVGPNSLVTVVGGPSPSLKASSTGGRSISNSPQAVAQVTPPLPPKPVKSVEKEWNSAPAPPQPTSREWNVTNNREWTKFNESPTSNVSSPGLKPVNFDMQRTAQAVVSDPQILHPVALRVTPVGGSDPVDDGEVMRRSLVYENNERETSPKQTEKSRESIQSDLRPIQRPQPKKLPAKGAGAIPPPPQREASLSFDQNEQPTNGAVSTKKDPPPLPPPRPHRHARSSSLDLNKLKLGGPLPPEVPPRVSPQMTSQNSCDAQVEGTNTSFADFTQFPQSCNDCNATGKTSGSIPPPPRPTIPSLQSSQRVSAFEVYRKPVSRNSQSPPPVPPPINTVNVAEAEKRLAQLTESLSKLGFDPEQFVNSSVGEVVAYLRDQNTALKRLCSDLNTELREVQRSREELKVRLERKEKRSGGSSSSSTGASNSSHQTNV
ncbi:ralBP1-associated Eps domain-containing protein 2 [Phlebotomus argentipes]|uniref:ralBP1-associated Eps domain-containing protein 2 n=1 Tax=Phlebotomus argentipes TaxID=94469 RepID=UPI0028929DDF|nr:ralBP1-associated Eps domain-containing protein 2 [Phlebotomus argentipes]